MHQVADYVSVGLLDGPNRIINDLYESY